MISAAEVAKHNREGDCWLILKTEEQQKVVCDVTRFLDNHPGGAEVMLEYAGMDATQAYDDIGHSKSAKRQVEKYVIGRLSTAATEPQIAITINDNSSALLQKHHQTKHSSSKQLELETISPRTPGGRNSRNVKKLDWRVPVLIALLLMFVVLGANYSLLSEVWSGGEEEATTTGETSTSSAGHR